MADPEMVEQLKRALERRLAQPPLERRADLIARGVIDEHGRVLKRMPEAPKSSSAKKRTDEKTP
ncbi:hypothetical protein AB1L88_16070 [Tautonia sp. JC769]|uniref:hypothetical protein n=1 Tax=Tautonia sp. JC769 TaxID=3232135 RepID=UPI00345A9B13